MKAFFKEDSAKKEYDVNVIYDDDCGYIYLYINRKEYIYDTMESLNEDWCLIVF